MNFTAMTLIQLIPTLNKVENKQTNEINPTFKNKQYFITLVYIF